MTVIMQCHTIVHGSACMDRHAEMKASYFDQEHTLLWVVSVAKGTTFVVKGLAEPTSPNRCSQADPPSWGQNQ